MIKMVFLLKRKPGLTRDEFIERYENGPGGHARMGERYAPEACRYARRYLIPMPDLFTGLTEEPAHDVITELWFDSQAMFDAAMARLSQPDVAAIIAADEDGIFDRPKNRAFMVDERESKMK